MIRAIVKGCFYVDHRIASDDAVIQCLLNTVFDRPDIFFWNNTANDAVDKFKAFAAFIRLDFDPYVTILTMTASLSDMLALSLSLPCDGFTIGDLRSAHVCLNFELAKHAVLDD